MSRAIRIIPGLAGGLAVWERMIDTLRRDLPGTEITVEKVPWQSSVCGEWATPGWDAAEAMAEMVRPGDVIVAHSFAATLMLAHLCSDQVAQPAVTVVVSPFYRPMFTDFDWLTLERYVRKFDEFLEAGIRAQALHQIDPEIRIGMARAVRDRMGPYGWAAFMNAYLATPVLPLHRITVPVRIVYGTQDDVAPPGDAVQLARRLPSSVLEPIHGAGHFPMSHDPESTALAIQRAHRDAERRDRQAISAIRSRRA